MSEKRISRRSILRGVGIASVAIALPPFEVMAPRARAQSIAEHALLFHFPDGVHIPDWLPATEGRGYETAGARASLEPFREHFDIVSGLSALAGGLSGCCGNPHTLPNVTVLTGQPVQNSEARGQPGGPSVDTVASELLGATHGYAVPLLLTQPYRRPISNTTPSATRDKTIRQPVFSPQAVFTQLFGAEMTEGERDHLRERRRSILDFVREDTTRLQRRLSSADQIQLDNHLQAIRELERRVEAEGGTCERPGSPPTDDEVNPGWDRVGERMDLLVDLQLMALRCSIVGVSHCSFGSTLANVDYLDFYEEMGDTPRTDDPSSNSEVHQISHQTRFSESYTAEEWYVALIEWRLRRFARVLDGLTQVEADGSRLIDSTLVVAYSEMSQGGRHDPYNLPILVAGPSREARGRHIKFPCRVSENHDGPAGPPVHSGYGRGHCTDSTMTPVANLWLAALRALGSGDVTFGVTSTEPIEDIWS